jgi:hypothetical protein
MLAAIVTVLSVLAQLAGGLALLCFAAWLIACLFDWWPEQLPPNVVIPIADKFDDDGTAYLRLELDSIDFRDVQRAVTRRQLRRDWPAYTGDGMSNVAGTAIAEICREWMAREVVRK